MLKYLKIRVKALFTKNIFKAVGKQTDHSAILVNENINDSGKTDRAVETGIFAKDFEKLQSQVEKLKEELKIVNKNLENEVDQRTKEVNRAKETADAILYKTPVPVAIVDISTAAYLRVNQAMQEFHKLSSEELLKRTTLDTYYDPENDRQIIIDQLREYGKIDGIEVHSRRIGTGEGRWTIISVHPITFLGKEVYITSLLDITDRKMMEKQLRTQTAAMESAVNAFVITNQLGHIQWVNPAFTNLTGYSLNDVIGQQLHILNSGKHGNAFYEKMWDTILSGNVWEGEIINKKKNGELYTEEMTITPVFDEGKKISQFVAIKHDITERKRLEEIVIKAKERMEGELNVARDIQMSMLPLIFPAFPDRKEIDVYANLIPAREVGGDFYDFYFLDENHFCVVIGDVSGKGVPAALMMAVTKTLLKSRAGNDLSTASILTHVNNEIAKDNDTYMFITIFMGILNINTGELVYTNAGHNPSYILTSDKKTLILDDLHGPVTGIMEQLTYAESKINLNKDDYIFAYTDGITESQNERGELFSDARLLNLLETMAFNSPKSLIESIIQEVKRFEDKAEQFDDITVLSLRYCQNPNSIRFDQTAINISNNLKEIAIAIEKFEQFALKNNLNLTVIQKFNVTLDELLNNVISYGYEDELSHVINIHIVLRGERLAISLIDDGKPFNPFKNDPADTKLSIEERKVGGLGIHLVKNLMDEYDYKRSADKNIITIVKHNIDTNNDEFRN
ncbi:SpoIIE family protein phosphatase [Bacteroidota bacterium]